MPRIKKGNIIRRPDLGMAVNAYMADAPTLGYIGLFILPIFNTVKQTSTYPVLPAEVMLSMQKTARAMRAAYNRSDFEYEAGIYATSENGTEEVIDDREAALYGTDFDMEMVATARATDIILRAQESRIAAKVFSSSRFALNAVTNEWDDAANADPVGDIDKGKTAIRKTSGMLPNTLIIPYSTFTTLRRCEQIVERMKYTTPLAEINSMTAEQLAAVLDVPKIQVGGAVYNGAKKGQNADISDIWDEEYAMLTVVNDSPDIRQACIGRTFLWTEESPGNTVVEEYREEGTRSKVIRVRHDTDEKLITSVDEDLTVQSDIAQSVSYLMSNITTTP